MNSARLTRKWIDAQSEPAKIVEALTDELEDSRTGFVTKEYLDKRLAEIETHLTPTVLLSQVAGFVGLATIVLLKS